MCWMSAQPTIDGEKRCSMGVINIKNQENDKKTGSILIFILVWDLAGM